MSVQQERILDHADAAMSALEQQWPDLCSAPSIRRQIAYLRAIVRGEEPDRSRLSTINVGVIAARDIEDRDRDAAAALHAVSALAHMMAVEHVP